MHAVATESRTREHEHQHGEDDLVPLVADHPAVPTVALVVATSPAARLRGGDRRRLVRLVSGAERRLARETAPSAARTRVVDRLWELAGLATNGPARQGVALVAGPDAGRLLSLHHPVTDRVLVGPAPTYGDLVERCWSFGRVAVLTVSERGARLLASDAGTLWELPGEGRPVRSVADADDAHHLAVPGEGPGDAAVAAQAVALVRDALPERTPLVLAGDDRLVDLVAGRPPVADRLAVVLPGDHSGTAPATLAALAPRALRRSLRASQQRAMAAVALGAARGDVARGPDAVRGGEPHPDDLLVVEEGLARTAPPDGVADVVDAAVAADRAVVVVPDGFLAHHLGVAVVPGHGAGA